MKNPFSEFYHVLSSQELLDIAFSRAMKHSTQVSKNAPIIVKAKKKETARIKGGLPSPLKELFFLTVQPLMHPRYTAIPA